MTAGNSFGTMSFSCRSYAAAAASHARIHSIMDTAENLVVSICIARLLDLRVLQCAA